MEGRKMAKVMTSLQFALYSSWDFVSKALYFSSSLAKT